MKRREHAILMDLYALGQTLENESKSLKSSPGAADVRRLEKRCRNWADMLKRIAEYEENKAP